MTGRPAGRRCRCARARRWPRPRRCSPSWTPRWWTRNLPGWGPREFSFWPERPVLTPVAAPAPLPRPALDSHTHLDMIDLPVPRVITAARAAGIARVVTIGTDLESSRWSARCAAEHDAVYAAVAIHPNDTESATALARR